MFWKSPIFYQNKWHTIIYTSNIPSNLEIFHITRFLSIASLQQKSNNLSCPKNGYYPVSVQSCLCGQEGSMKCGVEGSLSCTSHRKTYNDLFSDHIHSISEGNFSVVCVVTRFLGGTVIAVVDLRGARGTPAPPLTQNFFIFMQFSGKIGQIIGWYPPLWD